MYPGLPACSPVPVEPTGGATLTTTRVLVAVLARVTVTVAGGPGLRSDGCTRPCLQVVHKCLQLQYAIGQQWLLALMIPVSRSTIVPSSVQQLPSAHPRCTPACTTQLRSGTHTASSGVVYSSELLKGPGPAWLWAVALKR